MASYITFSGARPSESGKTSIWEVHSIHGACLGRIAWMGGWRKYAFHVEPHTVYEEKCLREIAEFCEFRTQLHRANKS